MTDDDHDPRGDAEHHAHREVARATLKASARHMLPALLSLAALILLSTVNWALAIYGAVTLPHILATLTALLAMVGLAAANIMVIRKAWINRERVDAHTSVQESKEKLRNQFNKIPRSPLRTARFWVRWLFIRLPLSALAFYALDQLMPRPAAIVCGTVLATAPIFGYLPPLRRLERRRTGSVVGLLTAEGEKPTPEI